MFRSLTRAQLTTDIVIASLLFLISAPLVAVVPVVSLDGGVDPAPGTQPLVVFGGLLSILVISVATAFRRLSPTLALAIAWAGAITQMSFGRWPSIEDIGILMVLYATAAYGSRRTMWWGLGSAGAGSLIAAAYIVIISGTGTVQSSVPEQMFIIGFVGVMIFVGCVSAMGLSWALGLLRRTRVRARQTEKERAVAEALAVAEAQRTQIARDMHDVVAHSLAVVIAQADGARYAAASDPEAAPAALRTIATTARGALSDVRLLLTQLRHSQAEGPQPTLADLEELYAQVRGAGVDLRIDVDPVPRADPPAAVQLAVYRILQEALTNAMRHGDGERVDVFFAWHPDRVDLGVHNAARGPVVDGAGHGLVGMRERAQLVGGRLEAGRENARFVVRATIPIAAPTQENA